MTEVTELADTMRSKIPDEQLMRFVEAYLMMATRANYRPGAPGDGCGNISLSADELADADRLRREAFKYALRFQKEEDGCEFRIGCSDFRTNRAFMFVIEAARQLASGASGNLTAIRLLKMAMQEIRDAS